MKFFFFFKEVLKKIFTGEVYKLIQAFGSIKKFPLEIRHNCKKKPKRENLFKIYISDEREF